ncbi:MAG: hypothetical protein R3212_03020 [Xanthomonadales bacterium]|nr:hypothetical protein [Xanthomonadales bacterium]
MALIAGLLLMASMVVLALAVATGMLLEKRMTGHFADGQLALQRARLGGQWASHWLQSRIGDPFHAQCDTACGPTPPVFEVGALPDHPEFEDAAWWRMNGEIAGHEPEAGPRLDYSLPGTEDPRWLIEALHQEPMEGFAAEPGEPPPTLGYYRVLSRGTGRYPGSIAVTETIIARPWVPDFEPAPFPPDADAPAFCDQVPEEIPCGRLGWNRRR